MTGTSIARCTLGFSRLNNSRLFKDSVVYRADINLTGYDKRRSSCESQAKAFIDVIHEVLKRFFRVQTTSEDFRVQSYFHRSFVQFLS